MMLQHARIKTSTSFIPHRDASADGAWGGARAFLRETFVSEETPPPERSKPKSDACRLLVLLRASQTLRTLDVMLCQRLPSIISCESMGTCRIALVCSVLTEPCAAACRPSLNGAAKSVIKVAHTLRVYRALPVRNVKARC